MADMFRDGDIRRSLERKNEKSTLVLLGGKLKRPKTKQFLFKHLGRRFDREFINQVLPAPLFEEDDDAGKVHRFKADQYNKLCTFALNKLPETEVPSKHKLHEYEGPLKRAYILEYHRLGERLKGTTK